MSDQPIQCSIMLNSDTIDEIARRAAAIVLDQLRADVDGSPYLSVSEAAARLRAKPQRIYDLLSARRLTRFKDGRRTLVSRDEIDAYLALNSVAPAWPHNSPTRMRSRLGA